MPLVACMPIFRLRRPGRFMVDRIFQLYDCTNKFPMWEERSLPATVAAVVIAPSAIIFFQNHFHLPDRNDKDRRNNNRAWLLHPNKVSALCKALPPMAANQILPPAMDIQKGGRLYKMLQCLRRALVP